VDVGPVLKAPARQHLEKLAAAPRPAGSAAEARARAYCAEVLSKAGLTVAEEPFAYSALPGRVGTPALGLLAGGVLVVAAYVAQRGNAEATLAILVGAGLLGGIAAWWLARFGVLSLPWMRAQSTNLVATRGNPSVWLVAHLDSKSQPVPILARALGVAGLLAFAILAVVVAAAQVAEQEVGWAWPWVTGLGLFAALPVAASLVRAESPGALDDASGVSTVLLVAQSLPSELALGVLLTSAEELGLAGARAWVRERGPAHAINVDGVDDAGDLRVMWTGKRPTTLVEVLKAETSRVGARMRAGRLFPGVMVDAIALADAGWRVVTVSRGTLQTVARIHTPRDSMTYLTGEGIALTASIIRAAITTGA
jgi:acetylornithine deacetylase/succinyl-diaminopimelate desuccinylase-like protein